MRAFSHDSSSFTGFRAILLAKAAPPSSILVFRGRRRLSKRRQIHLSRHHFARRLQGPKTWPADQRAVGQSSGHAPPFGGGADGRDLCSRRANAPAARRGARFDPAAPLPRTQKSGESSATPCCDATGSQSGSLSVVRAGRLELPRPLGQQILSVVSSVYPACRALPVLA